MAFYISHDSFIKGLPLTKETGQTNRTSQQKILDDTRQKDLNSSSDVNARVGNKNEHNEEFFSDNSKQSHQQANNYLINPIKNKKDHNVFEIVNVESNNIVSEIHTQSEEGNTVQKSTVSSMVGKLSKTQHIEYVKADKTIENIIYEDIKKSSHSDKAIKTLLNIHEIFELNKLRENKLENNALSVLDKQFIIDTNLGEKFDKEEFTTSLENIHLDEQQIMDNNIKLPFTEGIVTVKLETEKIEENESKEDPTNVLENVTIHEQQLSSQLCNDNIGKEIQEETIKNIKSEDDQVFFVSSETSSLLSNQYRVNDNERQLKDNQEITAVKLEAEVSEELIGDDKFHNLLESSFSNEQSLPSDDQFFSDEIKVTESLKSGEKIFKGEIPEETLVKDKSTNFPATFVSDQQSLQLDDQCFGEEGIGLTDAKYADNFTSKEKIFDGEFSEELLFIDKSNNLQFSLVSNKKNLSSDEQYFDEECVKLIGIEENESLKSEKEIPKIEIPEKIMVEDKSIRFPLNLVLNEQLSSSDKQYFRSEGIELTVAKKIEEIPKAKTLEETIVDNLSNDLTTNLVSNEKIPASDENLFGDEVTEFSEAKKIETLKFKEQIPKAETLEETIVDNLSNDLTIHLVSNEKLPASDEQSFGDEVIKFTEAKQIETLKFKEEIPKAKTCEETIGDNLSNDLTINLILNEKVPASDEHFFGDEVTEFSVAKQIETLKLEEEIPKDRTLEETIVGKLSNDLTISLVSNKKGPASDEQFFGDDVTEFTEAKQIKTLKLEEDISREETSEETIVKDLSTDFKLNLVSNEKLPSSDEPCFGDKVTKFTDAKQIETLKSDENICKPETSEEPLVEDKSFNLTEIIASNQQSLSSDDQFTVDEVIKLTSSKGITTLKSEDKIFKAEMSEEPLVKDILTNFPVHFFSNEQFSSPDEVEILEGTIVPDKSSNLLNNLFSSEQLLLSNEELLGDDIIQITTAKEIETLILVEEISKEEMLEDQVVQVSSTNLLENYFSDEQSSSFDELILDDESGNINDAKEIETLISGEDHQDSKLSEVESIIPLDKLSLKKQSPPDQGTIEGFSNVKWTQPVKPDEKILDGQINKEESTNEQLLSSNKHSTNMKDSELIDVKGEVKRVKSDEEISNYIIGEGESTNPMKQDISTKEDILTEVVSSDPRILKGTFGNQLKVSDIKTKIVEQTNTSLVDSQEIQENIVENDYKYKICHQTKEEEEFTEYQELDKLGEDAKLLGLKIKEEQSTLVKLEEETNIIMLETDRNLAKLQEEKKNDLPDLEIVEDNEKCGNEFDYHEDLPVECSEKATNKFNGSNNYHLSNKHQSSIKDEDNHWTSIYNNVFFLLLACLLMVVIWKVKSTKDEGKSTVEKTPVDQVEELENLFMYFNVKKWP